MKDVEQGAKFDEFELEDNYDFSGGIRGGFYKPKKIRTTLQLDDDILLFLKKQASEKHIKCLVPRLTGVLYHQLKEEKRWDKYYTEQL